MLTIPAFLFIRYEGFLHQIHALNILLKKNIQDAHGKSRF